jgi:protein-S-isoprenylcysteine O-methyltransferase Ste14
MVFSLVIEYFFPSTFALKGEVLLFLGAVIFVMAAVIIIKAKIEFKKFGQKSEPGEETTKIITTGIFGFSRNPIYLGAALITPAFSLLFDSLWVLFAGAIVVVLFKYLLIIPEERYLLAKFGDEYVAYVKKVRRWL